MTGNLPTHFSEASWKHRPPYKPQSPCEFGPVQWRGHCQCGRISFVLNREKPLNSKFCHCRGCQILHGAPFQWAAIFQKSDLSFVHGAEGLSFYSSSELTTDYTLPTKVSCTYCRTPILDEGRNMCMLFPTSIAYGNSAEEKRRWSEAFEVKCHIFYSQRVVDIPDGKPKWSGLDKSSDRVDDGGHRL